MNQSRRNLLINLGIVTGASALGLSNPFKMPGKPAPLLNKNFSFCLNTSTISGQKLGIVKEIETAAMAGFNGVEIWIPGLQAYLDQGGSLLDLRKKIVDLNIQVENAIGFAKWIVDDPNVRSASHDQLKKEMDWLRQLGCTRIAAPPFGATDEAGLDLDLAAQRYREILEIGITQGVIPHLEVWGFSKNLHKLSQALYVLAEAAHPAGRLLPDVYHLERGGSAVDGLMSVAPDVIEIFHLNDFPADIPADQLTDADRVYPGKGKGRISEILQYLARRDQPVVLSLELFNRSYWQQDALEVAKTGLQTMKEVVLASSI